MRMGEDGHGPCGNPQRVVFLIGRRQFTALLSYPDSGGLSLITNFWRILDMMDGGFIRELLALRYTLEGGRGDASCPILTPRVRVYPVLNPPGRSHS